MTRNLVLVVVLSAALAAAKQAAPSIDAPSSSSTTTTQQQKNQLSHRRAKLPLVLSGCVGAVSVLGSVPACRRSVLRLLGRAGGEQEAGVPRSAADEAAPSASSAAASSTRSRNALYAGQEEETTTGEAAAANMADTEKVALTPDVLARVADLNPRLEHDDITPLLDPIPVFTAVVGNGTSPLTVPTEDGRKLAYFFTEHADAEAFLRAVKQSAGLEELNAQVTGVALADIVRAYSSAEAKAANETFVLIPTMAEVAAARQLMRAAGTPQGDVSQLGPGSGLIPVFWSDALAVQSAGGKQRKVLFFRVGDLQHMWQNLSESRKKAGEAHADSMPNGPTVQVSDLQTMSRLLVEANKTDDVLFLPSSNALRRIQALGGNQKARARPAGGAGDGLAAGGVPEGGGSDDDGESGGGGAPSADFEMEDEDVGGVI